MRKRQPNILADLRSKRSRVHRALDRLEPMVADYRAKLAGLEAAIQVIAPELQLHPRRYKPNPVFARNELPRLALDVMRQAAGPIAVRTIAARALAAKGVALPDPHTMKRTRVRLQQIMVVWARRGMVRSVGSGREGMRELAAFGKRVAETPTACDSEKKGRWGKPHRPIKNAKPSS